MTTERLYKNLKSFMNMASVGVVYGLTRDLNAQRLAKGQLGLPITIAQQKVHNQFLKRRDVSGTQLWRNVSVYGPVTVQVNELFI